MKPNNSPEKTCCSTLTSVEPTISSISGLRRLLELELAELSLLGGAGLLCLMTPELTISLSLSLPPGEPRELLRLLLGSQLKLSDCFLGRALFLTMRGRIVWISGDGLRLLGTGGSSWLWIRPGKSPPTSASLSVSVF